MNYMCSLSAALNTGRALPSWQCTSSLPWTVCSGSTSNWGGYVTCNTYGRITAITMSNLGLTGTIPTSIGDMTTLTLLDLSSNNIHSTIPTSIGLLSNLNSFKIFSNSLSGTIPRSLLNVRNLLVLILDRNSLSGQVPPWSGTWPLLKVLRVFSNSFSGSIPSSICASGSLSLLWSYSNAALQCYASCLSKVSSLNVGDIPQCLPSTTLS